MHRFPFSPTLAFRCRALMIRLVCGVLALCVLSAASSAEDAAPAVRQLWQLLDYMAVDYAGAVSDGVITDASEFAEMREFANTIHERMQSLPSLPQRDALTRQSAALRDAVTRHAPSAEVESLARHLADQLLAAYPIPIAPQTPPDLARGATLYQEQCASCHGITGHGDGVAAASLTPAPAAFTDHNRARARSLFSLYATISQGVPETSMQSFSALPSQDRWALAFYTGTLAYPPSVRAEGAQIWTRERLAQESVPDLEALSRLTENDLTQALGSAKAGAVLGYLRSTPSAIGQRDGLALARALLRDSVRAYAAHDSETAGRLALSSYLDGIEPIEPRLATTDAGLLQRLEAAMGEYRARIDRGADPEQISAQATLVENLLDDSANVLGQTKADAVTTFVASFTILLREGLEALLVVVAIVAFLRKTGRRGMMGHVHGGWISALLAGAVTWFMATYLVNISGAQRELTEGFSSLFAAAVLLGVGLWMHQKSFAGRWQQYIAERLTQLDSGRSAWLLTLLVFITVYREVFETILFYVALTNDGNAPAMLAGLIAGTIALLLLAFAVLRFSVRLPLNRFFAISSAFIAVLAVVLAGKGAAALQEAGILSVRAVSFPRISLLGVSPSVQTLLAQVCVAAAAIAGFAYNKRSAKRQINNG